MTEIASVHDFDQAALIDTYIKLNHRHDWGAMRERCAEAPKDFNELFDRLYDKYAAEAPRLDELNDDELKTWLGHFAAYVDAKHGDILSYPAKDDAWFWHKTLGAIHWEKEGRVPSEFKVGEGEDEFPLYYWYGSAGELCQYVNISDALNKKICDAFVQIQAADIHERSKVAVWEANLFIFNEKTAFVMYSPERPQPQTYMWSLRYGEVFGFIPKE